MVIASLATLPPQITGDLGMQRVPRFLPYFVVGLLIRPEHFDLVRQRGARLVALPSFVVALALAYAIAPRTRSAWLYHEDAAVTLGAAWWAGPVMTFALKAPVYTHLFTREEWLHRPASEILTTLAACAVVTLFCTKPFRKALHFVMEPEMAWAFHKPIPTSTSAWP